MAAAASPMPPGRADSKATPPKPSAGWGVYPDTYFDRLPFCLSPAAYIVVGQVLRWTRWGPAARSRDQQRDWFSVRQKAWADKLGWTEGGLRKALSEAEDSGCLVTRKDGKQVEYSCAVDRFALAAYRKLDRSGNPSPGEKDPKPKPVPVPCSQDLLELCSLPELAGVDCQATGKHPLKTKGETEEHRNSSCGVCPAAEAKKTLTVEPEHRNTCYGIRPEIRNIVEGFTAQLGKAPTEPQLGAIEAKLLGASPEQFESLIRIKTPKIRSYAFLVHLAKDCAQSREAWERQASKHKASPSPASPIPIGAPQSCVKCHQETFYANEQGLCTNCAEHASAKPKAAKP
jgi:hypothetical protein